MDKTKRACETILANPFEVILSFLIALYGFLTLVTGAMPTRGYEEEATLIIANNILGVTMLSSGLAVLYGMCYPSIRLEETGCFTAAGSMYYYAFLVAFYGTFNPVETFIQVSIGTCFLVRWYCLYRKRVKNNITKVNGD